MGSVLNALVKLQGVENRLRAVKAKLTRCRRNVVIQENQIGNLRSTFEAKKEEVQLTKVQSDRLELELKSREERIDKLRSSLNNAKTNKEYAAILTQLNTTRADNSKIETQVLDLLKDIEDDEAECRQIKEQIEEQKEKLEQTRKQSEEMAKKYEVQIEEIQKEWDEVANEIPPEPLEIFRRVAETYDGEALVPIEGFDSQNYSCGGCYMSVTAESVNMLMSRDEIVRCPNCTRILVIDESEE